MGRLKMLRVVISSIFFFSFSWVFLEITRPNEYFTHAISALQFVPSFLEFLVSFLAGGGAGFILISILTLLFGRVYCSFLCPLGTLQDGIINLKSQITGPKLKHKYMKSYNWIQYIILALCAGTFIAGSITLLAIHEPFANFGRIMSTLVKPSLEYLSNALAYVLNTFEIYSLRPRQPHYISLPLAVHSGVFFSVVLFFSLMKGRLYCNTICPVGGLLSLFSRVSANKLKFVEDKCTSCGLCEAACKAGCIDYRNRKIDFSRCINCYNCIDACKFGAVKYKFDWKKEYTKEYSEGRKKAIGVIITAAGAGLMYFSGASKLFAKIDSEMVDFKVNFPVIPPGAGGLQRFTEKCIGCELCVTTCPSKVITPGFVENGMDGMLQPRMDYDVSFCNYSCNLCGRVCPTGALLPLSVDEKRLTQLGVAKFIENNCIVKTKGKQCTVCNEFCPTKACSMAPYKDGLEIPKVIDNICIGCGACEFACPARPKKAIFVQGHSVHKRALKPAAKPQKQRVLKEFPF